jgi:hypothetical protein
MADIKTKYGTAGQAIAITLAGLAQDAARASAAVSNETDLFLDVLVQLQIQLGTGTLGSDRAIYVYAYGTADDDPVDVWGDTDLDGTDKAITMDSPTNLRIVGVMNARASGEVIESVPMSLAAAFGGYVPRKWGIVVHNRTNIAFDATEANHKKVYQGILAQAV